MRAIAALLVASCATAAALAEQCSGDEHDNTGLLQAHSVAREGGKAHSVAQEGGQAEAESSACPAATADFYQYNLGKVASHVQGMKVNDGFIFSWLDGGVRKMAKTNDSGGMLAAGYVPFTSSTYYNTATWSSFIRNDNFGYFVTNFQCHSGGSGHACMTTDQCSSGSSDFVCVASNPSVGVCQKRGTCKVPSPNPARQNCDTKGLGEFCKSSYECMGAYAVCAPGPAYDICQFTPSGSKNRGLAEGCQPLGHGRSDCIDGLKCVMGAAYPVCSAP